MSYLKKIRKNKSKVMAPKMDLVKIVTSSRKRRNSLKEEELPSYLKRQRIPTPCDASPGSPKEERGFRKPFRPPIFHSRGSRKTLQMIRKLPSFKPFLDRKIVETDPGKLSDFIFNCSYYCEKRMEQGIFRKSGNSLRVGDVMHKLESGFKCDLDLLNRLEVNVVAEMIKFWMRHLPEPLLFPLYEKVIKKPDVVINIENMRDLLEKEFVEAEKIVILVIFRLLRKIVTKIEITSMSVEALAIVFTPNLYTKDLISLLHNTDLHKKATELTEFLILHCSNLELLPEDHSFFKGVEHGKKALMKALMDEKRVVDLSKQPVRKLIDEEKENYRRNSN